MTENTGTSPGSTNSSFESSERVSEVLVATPPTIRPALVLFTIVLVVGGGILFGLNDNPAIIFGDETLTELAMVIVGLLTVIIALRLLIRMIILRRTMYIIATDTLKRETDLLFRYWAREVPVDQLRGFEHSKNSIQILLGYGTIRLLTAGTNQSLGFLEFEDVPSPDELETYLNHLINQDATTVTPGELTDTNKIP